MKRIYHTWDKWECYPARFYENHPPNGMTEEECEHAYAKILSSGEFELALERVLREWKNSCEHYLSNESMNRIAWLGQASMCITTGVPARFRGGFNLMTDEQKRKANETALKYLNRWLSERGEPELTLESSRSRTVVNLY